MTATLAQAAEFMEGEGFDGAHALFDGDPVFADGHGIGAYARLRDNSFELKRPVPNAPFFVSSGRMSPLVEEHAEGSHMRFGKMHGKMRDLQS